MNKAICEVIILNPEREANFTQLPYATEGSAAFDVLAVEDILISKTPTHVDLGFKLQVAEGFAAIILPRSGQGSNYGCALSNTAGLIDSDYQGEWKVSVFLNGGGLTGEESLLVEKGKAFCQVIIVPVVKGEFKIVSEFSRSSGRGEGGHGSTDKMRV